MTDASPNATTARGLETARLLLDIKAVNFRPEEPYMLTSGWASPVYIDCRWVISFLDARRRIIKMGADMLAENIDMESVDMMAGGETAGIPYSSWLSEELSKPMLYVRKKPKGFGRNAQIEGSMPEGAKVKRCGAQALMSPIFLWCSFTARSQAPKKRSQIWASNCTIWPHGRMSCRPRPRARTSPKKRWTRYVRS